MRKYLVPIIAACITALVIASFAIAQPGIGITKTAPLSGTGSTASPLKITPCSDGQILKTVGSSWSCVAAGCYASGTACSLNGECCSLSCSGGTCTSIIEAGTNIDIAGSTVSVEPTVTLAGESNADTLDILNSATAQTTMPIGIDLDFTGSVNIAATTTVWAVDINNSTTCNSGCNGDTIVLNNGGVRINVGTVDGGETGLHVDSGLAQFDDTLTASGGISTTALSASATVTGADLAATDDLTVGDDADIDGSLIVGTSSSDALTVNATTTHTAPTTVQDLRYTELTPSTFGTSQDDYNPTNLATATTLRLQPTANVNLTGLQGGASGRRITIINIASSFELTIAHETTSTLANRFTFPNSLSWTLYKDCASTFEYDGTASRWKAVGWQCDWQREVKTIGGSSFGDNTNDTMAIGSTMKDSSTAPSYSSCGSSPAHVTGGTNWFSVTVGTGGVTACTATFASTKTNTPVCIARVNNSTEDVYISAVSATAVTVTAKSGTTDLSSDTISVFCGGDA